MTYEELIERLDPSVYQNLRRAIELGKWPDGRRLSDDQRRTCMEAVIYYENRHNIPEQERVGYIDRGHKAGGETCGSASEAEPVRILGNRS